MNTMTYKGYIGSVNYSDKDQVFFGKIEGINGLVNFEGESLNNWTDLQAVVPARASISSRTRCATADASSSMPYLPASRHSPSCGIRSELSPFITTILVCDAKI